MEYDYFLKNIVDSYRDELEVKELDLDILEVRDTRMMKSIVFKTNSLLDFLVEFLEKYGVRASRDTVLDYSFQDIKVADWKGSYNEFIRSEYIKSKQFNKDNLSFKWYNDKGFQLGNYAEFFLHYEPINYVSLTNMVRSFNIGLTEINIGRPSKMFKAIKDSYLRQQIDGCEHEIGWNDITTVKLENITIDCESLLQQVLYIISKYTHSNIYPSIKCPFNKSENNDGYYKKVSNKNRGYLKKAQYIEPIMYFNLAKNENTTGKILNFYKAVEFFYEINRDEELISFIQRFEHDISPSDLKLQLKSLLGDKDIGKLILVFRKVEKELSVVINEAFENNLIENKTIESFANCFYRKRNELVHHRNKKQIFRILSSNDLNLWASVFERVAEICINDFCFDLQSIEAGEM
ncbi:hypothetical protein [Priestia sp. FSL R5-0680]|uniref:hypothetical protein n=1 Tax=Priestia sp. FSL R5-0680 TaxID=2921582 RepID=UPI0030F52D7A